MQKSLAPVATLALLVSSFSQVMAKGPQILDSVEFVPNELIVKFRENALNGNERETLISKGLDLKESVHTLGGEIFVVRFDSSQSLHSQVSGLSQDPAIEYVEPNFIYRAIESDRPLEEKLAPKIMENMSANSPNDTHFGVLWGLYNDGSNEPNSKGQRGTTPGVAGADIKALSAWEIEKGDPRIKIAIIDTGIDYEHPDLKNNIWVNEAEQNGKPGVDDDNNGFIDDIHGMDFVNNDGDPMDDHNHGTHCAGTIAAEHDNGVGVAGVMAHASLVGVKFLSASGSGSLADAVKAIDYATRIGVNIMSNSWGGGGFSQALEDAIKRAKEAGIVFVAAAGNSGTNNDSAPHYPSSYNVENVIAVAASDARENLASFSCYGGRSVHLAAPGHNIMSSVAGGGYQVYSGTSMATPHVSGAIGLLLSHQGDLTLSEVRERIMATSDFEGSYRRKVIGHGRLNAFNLLTDHRPERSMPKESDWVSLKLTEAFESPHPYASNSKLSRSFNIPGAKYLRVVVKKYETEARYDNLVVRAPGSRTEVEKLSGAGEGFYTDYVEGDSVEVEFSSDYSLNKWGFLIEEIQYVPGDHLVQI